MKWKKRENLPPIFWGREEGEEKDDDDFPKIVSWKDTLQHGLKWLWLLKWSWGKRFPWEKLWSLVEERGGCCKEPIIDATPLYAAGIVNGLGFCWLRTHTRWRRKKKEQ